MRNIIFLLTLFIALNASNIFAEKSSDTGQYLVGIDDVLEIILTEPQEMIKKVVVAPDGAITFPYIGRLYVKNKTLQQIKEDIENGLKDGYMKYPVLTVYLDKSNSRNFFVYGEVVNPGSYVLHENMTVLRAIAIAGGFTKYGSQGNIKVLRERKNGKGYDTIEVNIKEIMSGKADEDIELYPGDMIIVGKGVF